MIEISVVIPSRNRWPHLSHAVACALAQRNVDHEVIVVLDASTDESEQRLAALGDPRVSIRLLHDQQGVAGARNAGIAAAKGGWVAFLDDDDRWSPEKLRRTLSAGSGHDFAYGPAIIVDAGLGGIANAPAPAPTSLLSSLLVQNVMPAGSSNVIVRRELLEDLGGFDERLFHLADWDAWIRLARYGTGGVSASIDVAYVQHDLNLALTDLTGLRRDVELLRSRYADLARAQGVRLDRGLFDRWVASGQRRVGRKVAATRILLRSALRDGNAGNLARAADALLTPAALRRTRRSPSVPDWLLAQRNQGFPG